MINNVASVKARELFKRWDKEARKKRGTKRGADRSRTDFASRKTQSEFISTVLGFMVCDGISAGNLKRMEKFIDMQIEGLDENRMEIQFVGGRASVIAVLEDIRDLDFEDIHNGWGFDQVIIFKGDRKAWTVKAAKRLVKELEDDITYEDLEANIWYEIEHDKLTVFCNIWEPDEPDDDESE